MKCSRRSVTNLADLTIGLPGSLNVRVLCSMYRTSHIKEERRLRREGKEKKERTYFISSSDYETGERALCTAYNLLLSHLLVFCSTLIKTLHTSIRCPVWPAEGSVHRLPTGICTNDFENKFDTPQENLAVVLQLLLCLTDIHNPSYIIS